MKSIYENDVQMTEVHCNSTQLKKQSNFSSPNVESINKQNKKIISPVAVLNFKSDVQRSKKKTSNEITMVTHPGSTTYNQYDLGFTPKQIILLKAQLTKHVQLVTQNYLLCAMSERLKMYRRKFKITLVSSEL